MDVSTLKVNVFMRKLLLGSIGKLTIESEEWELPVNVKIPFGRTFFNDRLKYATPINIKTHRGLIFIFSYLFSQPKKNNLVIADCSADLYLCNSRNLRSFLYKQSFEV